MFRANTPQLFVDIDRTKCESLMVPVSDVFNTLQTYMGGYYVNLFNLFGRTWQVNLQAEGDFRTQGSSVRPTESAQQVGPDGAAGHAGLGEKHRRPGHVHALQHVSLGRRERQPGAGRQFRRGIRVHGKPVPTNWTFAVRMDHDSPTCKFRPATSACFVFGLGSMLVFLVLAAKYESWKLPLAVILVVPMCLLCSVAGMMIAHLPVDIFVQIGFLVLVGMAAKNAILIVEFAQQQRDAGARSARSHGRSLPFAIAADHDDQLRLHPRRGAVDARATAPAPNARFAGHRRVLRHDRRDAVRHFPDAGVLLCDYVPPGAPRRGCKIDVSEQRVPRAPEQGRIAVAWDPC